MMIGVYLCIFMSVQAQLNEQKNVSGLNLYPKGYNVFSGTSHPIHTENNDPGMSIKDIFRLTYNNVDPNAEYYLPDCCDESFTTQNPSSISYQSEEVGVYEEYQESISLDIRIYAATQLGFLLDWSSMEFTMNTDFTVVFDVLYDGDTIITETSGYAPVFTIGYNGIDGPDPKTAPLSSSFVSSFFDLPLVFNEKTKPQFFHFIAGDYDEEKEAYANNGFGTHYISEMTGGSSFFERSYFTSKNFSYYSSTNKNIQAAAESTAFFDWMVKEGEASMSDATEEQKEFDLYRSSYELGWLGIPPTSDLNEWVAQTRNYPAAIKLKLHPLQELMIPKFMSVNEKYSHESEEHILMRSIAFTQAEEQYCYDYGICGQTPRPTPSPTPAPPKVTLYPDVSGISPKVDNSYPIQYHKLIEKKNDNYCFPVRYQGFAGRVEYCRVHDTAHEDESTKYWYIMYRSGQPDFKCYAACVENWGGFKKLSTNDYGAVFSGLDYPGFHLKVNEDEGFCYLNQLIAMENSECYATISDGEWVATYEHHDDYAKCEVQCVSKENIRFELFSQEGALISLEEGFCAIVGGSELKYSCEVTFGPTQGKDGDWWSIVKDKDGNSHYTCKAVCIYYDS